MNYVIDNKTANRLKDVLQSIPKEQKELIQTYSNLTGINFLINFEQKEIKKLFNLFIIRDIKSRKDHLTAKLLKLESEIMNDYYEFRHNSKYEYRNFVAEYIGNYHYQLNQFIDNDYRYIQLVYMKFEEIIKEYSGLHSLSGLEFQRIFYLNSKELDSLFDKHLIDKQKDLKTESINLMNSFNGILEFFTKYEIDLFNAGNWISGAKVFNLEQFANELIKAENDKKVKNNMYKN